MDNKGRFKQGVPQAADMLRLMKADCEVLAVIEGIQVAVAEGITKLQVACDTSNVIHVISNRKPPSIETI